MVEEVPAGVPVDRVHRLAFFKAKREVIIAEEQELLNEIQREPEAVKVFVFGSKERWAKRKEFNHDWDKLAARQEKEATKLV